MTETERKERMVEIVRNVVMTHSHWIVTLDDAALEGIAESIARNAVQAMQGIVSACPRCSTPLPQYDGLCDECAKAPDHEHYIDESVDISEDQIRAVESVLSPDHKAEAE